MNIYLLEPSFRGKRSHDYKPIRVFQIIGT
jgi:hypothetical protein